MLYYRTRKLFTNKFNFRFTVTKCILILVIISFVVHFGAFQNPNFKNSFYPDNTTLKGNLIVFSPSSVVSAEVDPVFTEPAKGVVTSPFGQRWGRLHEGIDIGGVHGSEIVATEDGVVELAQWVNGYGNYVKIMHRNGYSSAYGHCDSLLVSSGDVVAKGQTIATMGNTGNSTGTHLHFEILYQDEPQNPLNHVMY